jgi:diadenosine tetraphosphate (Ap4A) HIT family hydrolase
VSACPFCERIESVRSILASNDSAVAFADAYPVTDGHTLVVPRRHVARAESLSTTEWTGLFELARQVAQSLAARSEVDGVNLGLNSGMAAGQTVDHAHLHVIPRRQGDVADSRGGVRWVIPGRADYWSAG